jgi:hypothetical protein
MFMMRDYNYPQTTVNLGGQTTPQMSKSLRAGGAGAEVIVSWNQLAPVK